MAVPNDTSAEAERILSRIYREMSAGDKWRRLDSIYRTAKILHATGVRSRNPAATPEEIHHDWLSITLGESMAQTMRRQRVTPSDESLPVVQHVAAIFTQLGVPYALGGSMASTIHGEPRFTEDADLMVEPFPGLESTLVARLGADYYISPSAVEEAVRQRSSFNIIYLHSGFKVDVFVRKEREFDRSVMSRRRPTPLPDRPGEALVVVSPEDVIGSSWSGSNWDRKFQTANGEIFSECSSPKLANWTKLTWNCGLGS